jgi:hypothetical protein
VAKTQDPFGVQPAIRDDPKQGGSEDGGDTHRPIDAAHLFAVKMKHIEHISAQRDEPGPPDKEFQEIHDGQAELYIHESKIKN